MARPKGQRRGRYRMTPARRAALKKAQTASAKKRRRREIAGTVGRGALKLGGTMVAYHTTRYMMNPRKISKDYNDLKAFGGKVNNRLFGNKKQIETAKKKYSNMMWVP